ncbi:MAG: hypothetical protein ACI4KA_04310 [Oscillospiraceae bacterium]
MDDMKKLVERYKRELMEYSRTAKNEVRSDFSFPEMTEPEPKHEEIPQTSVEESAPPHEVNMPMTSGEMPEESAYHKDNAAAHEDEITDNPQARPEDMFAPLDEMNYEGVSTVTPEQAERLDEIPESGVNIDEQLGRRDFEEQEQTTNSPDDIQPLVQQGEAPKPLPEREYETLEEFTSVNNRRGSIRFAATAARGAFPVPGARVVISRKIGGKDHVFYVLTTDISGLTPVVTVPAPPKELSESPGSIVTPYATYNAAVSADGYNNVSIINLPVFEGVMSMQRIALVPALLGENEVITESEPDLNGGA